MGFFSDVVDTVGGFFGGGGGSDVTVTQGQAASQDIKVNVNPATNVAVSVPPVDLSPVARGIKQGYTEFSQAVGSYGESLAIGLAQHGQAVTRGQLALTSAAQRSAQTEAEKILQDKQQFAWIKQTGKKVGGFALILAGTVLFIYAASRR